MEIDSCIYSFRVQCLEQEGQATYHNTQHNLMVETEIHVLLYQEMFHLFFCLISDLNFHIISRVDLSVLVPFQFYLQDTIQKHAYT